MKSDGRSEVHSVSLVKGIVSQIEHLGRSFAASDTTHYNLVRPFDIVYTRSPLAIYKLGIVKQHKATGNAIVSPLYGCSGPTIGILASSLRPTSRVSSQHAVP